MYLKSITLKGFKSFPDRTRLEFGPGVSVIVGPNGSGKSNITDAVLWALGEQSPLAVRGQTMQDVIFAGGHGVRGRSAAEVEVVIDNSDGRLRSEFSEISISRQLDRSGEGIYRLNGARCRLVDVIEVLSDTGLGKEMHSVISQGRVEAIVTSKPADRTALIEEAAGLSKYRKRRHRAQLKLGHTQDNLGRALDVEREARSRLRPLKRQAEAADLHARLERQSLELRARLVGEEVRAVRVELAESERSAREARRERERVESQVMEVARARERVEHGFAEHGRSRERLSSEVFAVRSAAERISIRLESARDSLRALSVRLERSRTALGALGRPSGEGEPRDRLGALEAELERLERERSTQLDTELADLEVEREQSEHRVAKLGEQIDALEAELRELEHSTAAARAQRVVGARRIQSLERRRAPLEIELAAIDERLAVLAERSPGDSALADRLEIEPDYEAAVGAALGERLLVPVVADLQEGVALLRRAAGPGARALIARAGKPARPSRPPAAAAERLIDHVRPDRSVSEVVKRLLVNVWVVKRLADVPADFSGIAVTREGLIYNGSYGEVGRLSVTGAGGGLADRQRRAKLVEQVDGVVHELDEARADLERSVQTLAQGERRRDAIELQLRELRRSRDEASESSRRAAWLVEQRREHGGGSNEARRAELAAEIGVERRLAERLEREHGQRERRRARLSAQIAHDENLLPAAQRAIGVIEDVLRMVEAGREELESELFAGEQRGERVVAELRELAQSEYELQARLREASELLTQEEVRLAQTRDRGAAETAELEQIGSALGIELPVPDTALADRERHEVEAKLARLERRRERIGPINPLAAQEYEQALEHVEELESQRKDLEAALAELLGLIRETDRRIRESFEQTFEAAARNFEEVIERLFPGGRGRLRKVGPARPRAVLGGAEESPAEAKQAATAGPDDGHDATLAAQAAEGSDDETPGIEIEVTPAGKATKRLSLLSGGEKSLVALAFMFAVFLARPCPFYVLDEVEAALDDTNIDRFLNLLKVYSERAQFIVVTHQRRTMEAADVLYGVSMGRDGVSRVISRRLASQPSQRLGQAA